MQRKALGQADSLATLHPHVQHMLLLDTQDTSELKVRWIVRAAPLALRIRRIDGRPMAALSGDALLPTRPDAIF